MERFFDGGGSEFVGGPYAHAPLDPTAGHPHGKAIGVVVPSGPFGVLGCRLATEFSAPDDQRLVEQSASFEVRDQTGDRFVGVARMEIMVLFQIGVRVPIVVVVGASGVDLNEPDAPFDEPTR